MTKMVFMASMLATFLLSPSAFANDTYKQEVEALKAQKERQQAAQEAQSVAQIRPYLCAKTGLLNMMIEIKEEMDQVDELISLLDPTSDANRIESLRQESAAGWKEFMAIRTCATAYRSAYRDQMMNTGVFVGTSEIGKCTNTTVTCDGQKISLSRKLIKKNWKK